MEIKKITKITGRTYQAKDILKSAGAKFVRENAETAYWIATEEVVEKIKKMMNPSYSGRKNARLLEGIVIGD